MPPPVTAGLSSYFWSTLLAQFPCQPVAWTNFGDAPARLDFGRPTPALVQAAAEAADLDALPFTRALRHRVQIIFTVNWHPGHELRIACGKPRDWSDWSCRSLTMLSCLWSSFAFSAPRLVPALAALSPEAWPSPPPRRPVLLLDRKIDGAVLPVDVDDHRVDAVAFLRWLRASLDAVARDLGGAQ